MIYRLPSNIRYVDMCIYIDDHVYTEEYDEDLIFQYLYHLAMMLSKKGKYFSNQDDYDNFSIFVATKVFLRLTMRDDLPKITSILNYLRKVIGPYKVDYQKSEFSQRIVNVNQKEENNYNFNNLLYSNMLDFNIADFSLVLGNIPATCNKFLSSLPYRKDSSIWHNIYISVMLTFLNSVTLSRQQEEYLDRLTRTNYIQSYHVAEQFDKSRNNDPILFHLPESMSNYITVLSRQLKHIIAKELGDIMATKVHSDYVLSEQYKDIFIEEDLDDDSQ